MIMNVTDEMPSTVRNLHPGLALSEGSREDALCLKNCTSSWCSGSELGLILAPPARGQLEKSRNV